MTYADKMRELHASYAPVLKLLDGATVIASDADAKIAALQAECEALRADADKFGDALLLAAIACPHSIDSNRIVLHFDAKQTGHNALNQLSTRLRAAIDNERSKA